MKTFFYCQSYQAFNLAIKMSQERKVVVITGARNIIKACEYLQIDYIKHDEYRAFDIVKTKKCVKKEIERLLEEIGNEELHFSHTQFAIFLFILISEASKQNKNIFFHNFEFVYDRVKSLRLNKGNLFLLFNYFAIKTIYNAPIQLGMSGPGVYMLCLNLSFLNNKSITIISDKDDYYSQTLQLFKNLKINFEPINILFIAQTFDDPKFFNKEKINEIIQVINNNRVHVKMHPKIENSNLLEKCSVLPSFLPVEFFFSGVIHCVISFHSAALVTASQFENLRVISLLNIVGVDNGFTRKVKADLMQKSNGRIVFPQNISELTKLIYDETD